MLILKTKFDFMTDLMSTNENYSYLCDVISLLDMLQELTSTEKGCHFLES